MWKWSGELQLLIHTSLCDESEQTELKSAIIRESISKYLLRVDINVWMILICDLLCKYGLGNAPWVDQNIFYTLNIFSILVKRRDICLKRFAWGFQYSESVFERTCLHLNINYWKLEIVTNLICQHVRLYY